MTDREESAKRITALCSPLLPDIATLQDRIHEILPPDDRAVVALVVADQFLNQAAQYEQQRSEELAAMPVHRVARNLVISHCDALEGLHYDVKYWYPPANEAAT